MLGTVQYTCSISMMCCLVQLLIERARTAVHSLLFAPFSQELYQVTAYQPIAAVYHSSIAAAHSCLVTLQERPCCACFQLSPAACEHCDTKMQHHNDLVLDTALERDIKPAGKLHISIAAAPPCIAMLKRWPCFATLHIPSCPFQALLSECCSHVFTKPSTC